MEKQVKCRKDHKCCVCDKIIKRGEMAHFFSSVNPRFESCHIHAKQVGIEYVKYWSHPYRCELSIECQNGDHKWVSDSDSDAIDDYCSECGEIK